MVLGDSRDGLDSPVGREDEEEMLLRQAIALSLEEAEDNDNEEEDNNEEDGEEEEEELMLRQAIALSLEGAEEEDDQQKTNWILKQPQNSLESWQLQIINMLSSIIIDGVGNPGKSYIYQFEHNTHRNPDLLLDDDKFALHAGRLRLILI